MAAIATKKPGGDFAVQLTFPTVFEAVEKASGRYLHPSYALESRPVVTPQWAGTDFQSAYHDQKMRDANYMALARVQSTKSSEAKMLKYHANYNLPKPVLSQRVFANPSLGSGGIGGDVYSARSCASGSGSMNLGSQIMRGGVLFTVEGQTAGRQRLFDRIGQINAAKNAKELFIAGDTSVNPIAQPAEVPMAEDEAEQAESDFVTLRNSVMDAITGGSVSRDNYKDLIRMNAELVKFAPEADAISFQDTLAGYDAMERAINASINTIEHGGEAGENEGNNEGRRQIEILTSMLLATQKGRFFAQGMYEGRREFGQPREIAALSKALVRQTGLNKELPIKDVDVVPRGAREEPAAGEAIELIRDKADRNKVFYLRSVPGHILPKTKTAAFEYIRKKMGPEDRMALARILGANIEGLSVTNQSRTLSSWWPVKVRRARVEAPPAEEAPARAAVAEALAQPEAGAAAAAPDVIQEQVDRLTTLNMGNQNIQDIIDELDGGGYQVVRNTDTYILASQGGPANLGVINVDGVATPPGLPPATVRAIYARLTNA